MEKKETNLLIALIVFFIIAALSAVLIYSWTNQKKNTAKNDQPGKTELQLKKDNVLSLKNSGDKKRMEERKNKYGVNNVLDLVVKSDEKIKINNKILDMKKIDENERIKGGTLVSLDLKDPSKGHDPRDYGIYIVKKGDNLWDIHFRILKELFNKKGITLSLNADEPVKGGYSSGVGKILKFSEKMVSIYSLDNVKIEDDINILEPDGKVVIYKMDDIESLLKDMSEKNINNVIFDGKNLWVESL